MAGIDAMAVATRVGQRTTASPLRVLRMAVAAGLGLLVALPVYRLLDRPGTGLAGQATLDMASAYASLTWAGLILLLIPALLLSRLVPAESVERAAAGLGRALVAPRTAVFAAAAALIAFVLAGSVVVFVLGGQPVLVDAMSQLLHARYLAAGRLAGPGPELGAFWQTQQSLFTPGGWVSQYPPMHALLLAAGVQLGAPWAVGPLMLALTALFTILAAQRLLPGDHAVARAGGLLVAISPFLLGHAAAYMNHSTAAAFGAFALWCAIRAGGAGWLLGAGIGLGAMFATRPLSALTLGLVLLIWLVRRGPGEAGWPRLSARLCWVALGALPFTLGIAAYNAHFFGSPWTFGYTAALGPAAGLGFGTDPWGNSYGPLAALAYTSAELTALSLFLLETPLPLVLVIATYVLVARRLEAGEWLLLGWAVLPLAVQSLYWHHGLFMGPRMLYESAPAWCLLAVLAAVRLVQRSPSRLAAVPGWSPRVLLTTMFAGALLAGLAVLAPQRLAGYTQRSGALEAAAAAEGPALVFVHGGWTSRLSMRLASLGMRLDSVEAALTQNPTCAVQYFVDARADGSVPLEFGVRGSADVRAVELSPGNRIRVRAGETLAGRCAREAAADRLGAIDVTPLLWRGDPPGVPGRGVMFVRDLGPEENARLIAAYPDRRRYLLHSNADGRAELADYAPAMRTLWASPGA